MGKIFVFTGKGGVGKTSIAAAHARYSAQEGRRTLLVSTDMAHNLSDIFETPIGSQVTPVTENLEALEIDPAYVIRHDFTDMMEAFADMTTSTGMASEDMEEMAVLPGMDELFALLEIMALYQSCRYDRVVVDCAPTGETLSLLKFPELLSWYFEKVFPLGKIAMRVLSPVSRKLFKLELPNRKAINDIEKLYLKLIELQELLKNPEITAIRLVAVPEKMVEETRRNHMVMNLYSFPVDSLYINRILPEDIGNPFFTDWIAIQKQYIDELEALFADLPVYHIPWFDTDLNGLEGIDRIVESTLRGRNVFDVQVPEHREVYEKTETGYTLRLYLPFVDKEALDLHESAGDIILKTGNYKRNIPKPDVLRRFAVAGAGLVDNTLTIRFERKDEDD